jgi:hypothetical protein
MNKPLPPEVAVTELPDGIRYALPRRKPEHIALQGTAGVMGGLVGIGFLTFWLYAAGYHINWAGRFEEQDFLMLGFLLFGGWMFSMALRHFGYGLSLFLGHSEIELRGNTLAGYECCGGLRWGWPRRVAGLRRLDVGTPPSERLEGESGATEHNVISATWDTKSKPLQLAYGYPRAWLLPLAAELSRRCRFADEVEPGVVRAPVAKVDVIEESLPNRAGFIELADRPGESKFRVEMIDGGVKLTMPPDMLGFGEVVLAVSGDQLLIERHKLTGVERHHWRARQLTDVRVGRIIDSEHADTFELLVDLHPGEGKRFRLPTQSEAEARWLATTLRQALGLTDEQSRSFLEREEQPAGSVIEVQRTAEGVALTVPPPGFTHPTVRNGLITSFVPFAFAGVLCAVNFYFPGNMVVEFLGPWLALTMLCILILLGVSVVVHEVGRAHNRLVLGVVGDTLFARRTTLLGTGEQWWKRRQVADVRVGRTGEGRIASPGIRQMAVDMHDPIWELQIHLKTGEIVRFLDDYGDAELQWMATVLRRALRVPVEGLSEMAQGAGAAS